MSGVKLGVTRLEKTFKQEHRRRNLPFELLALLLYQGLYPLKYFGEMRELARDVLSLLGPAFEEII